MTESCNYDCSNCPYGFKYKMECVDEFENELVTVSKEH